MVKVSEGVEEEEEEEEEEIWGEGEGEEEGMEKEEGNCQWSIYKTRREIPMQKRATTILAQTVGAFQLFGLVLESAIISNVVKMKQGPTISIPIYTGGLGRRGSEREGLRRRK